MIQGWNLSKIAKRGTLDKSFEKVLNDVKNLGIDPLKTPVVLETMYGDFTKSDVSPYIEKGVTVVSFLMNGKVDVYRSKVLLSKKNYLAAIPDKLS
jgi:hypothetical protein